MGKTPFIGMKCDKCKKKSKSLYCNRLTNKWECQKCTPYLKSDLDEETYFKLDKPYQKVVNNLYSINSIRQ